MPLVFRILNGFMAALFVFAAMLQYNDPDPARWMAIYLAAAAACALAAAGRANWLLPAAVAAVALIWSATKAAHGAWSVPPSEMFAEWEMKNQQVLETREMFGLLIIGSWMVLVAIVARKRRPLPQA